MLINAAYFTTEAYPRDSRLDAWRGALRKLSLQAKHLDVGEPIHGTTRSIATQGGITFAWITSGPQAFSFRDGDGERGLWLALQLEGAASLTSGARTIELATGDIAIGTAGVAADLTFDSNFRQFFVRVPDSVLHARLLSPTGPMVSRLPGQSGLGLVFSCLLRAVSDAVGTLTPAQIRPVEIALVELLATTLADDAASNHLHGTTQTQTAHLGRICQLIEARLHDPDLSLAGIAEEEGLSVRYLQKLFENAGESFVRYVRLRRLERCRLDLTNPLYTHLSITDICYRWGFNDSAHFSRAFRERYGRPPRAYRRETVEAMANALPLQVSRGWPDQAQSPARAAKPGHKVAPPAARALTASAKARHGAAATGPAGKSPTARRSVVHHYLAATDATVHWGYFSRLLRPVLTVESGDFVTVETLTQHAYDDYDRMIKGDSGAESVFRWTRERKNVDRRGAGPMDASIYGRGAGEGFGVHICTGPVAIRGAEPGDVIEIRIIDLQPRLCANAQYAGRAFGSNAATWWGFHYHELLTEPKPREVVTIYEIDCVSGGEYARAVYNFQWTPQTDPFGVVHPTIDYPGVPVDHSTIVENHDVLKSVRVQIRPHFGVIGLAPKEAEIVDSIPPAYFGGNLDNWRAGKGSTLYLPVSVPGGLLSVGDPHASQGDSELCGTAIECSLTGVFQLVLHKREALALQPIADLSYPLIETPDEWVLHGFSSPNYLAELGKEAQSEIYKRSSLDPAMQDAFRKMRRFLMTTQGLSEDEAISLMSVAVDFGITQVVDGNWCVHAVLRKSLFGH